MEITKRRGGRFSPELQGSLRLTLIYLLIGAAWIALSDRVLGKLVPDPRSYAELQTIKGWFYVAATSVLFGYFAFTELRRIAVLQARELQARREYEATITTALHEKEVLLRELNHRVKNNLQLISSLVSLRMDRIIDPDSLIFFREFLSRLKAMALVYDSLFATNAFATVDLGALIREAVAEYAGAFGSLGIRFSSTIEEGLSVDMQKAVPIALILNEAVLNAIGHAFPDGRGGSVLISTRHEGDSMEIEIRDDGVGFDPTLIDKDSLGLTIVRSLAQQIDASIELPCSDSGTTLILRLPNVQAALNVPPVKS